MPTDRPLRVYIAAPYTQGDPVENTHRAIRAGDAVVVMGQVPFIPHLSLLWHMVTPRADVNFWYEYDLHWLRVCDALLRLPGESTGADAEEAEARRIGMPVCYGLGELQLLCDSGSEERLHA